ncbi:hypothetical protein [Corynebacterium sp. 805_CJEI]|uniref:hypothetical protein n=1 Tax=Corynebacterium sp. 805_CJEI TaxID=2715677 RepID=UPI000666BF5A|nr:hypothetical protein [Corynebacterium sp. 805_CJEI]
MADVLALAQSPHQRYDRIKMRQWKLFTPRAWNQLPAPCQAEFIGIVNAVITHQPTYNGIPVPEWVKDHIKEKK